VSDDRHEYIVNLHVHSTYSDGTGTIDDVISTAARYLDVLLINDHDTLAARENGYEGYYGDLLVLVGWEISGPFNHYLVFNTDRTIKYKWNEPQAFINAVRDIGGAGFVAHPYEKGSPLNENGKVYTWEDWSVNGFDGLEIWNHSSSWKALARNKATAVYHYFLRTWTLPGPEKETLEKWDEIGQKRRIAGVAGSDAHAFSAHLGPVPFNIFKYADSFQALNTHLLLPESLSGDVRQDRKTVIDGLVAGSAFCAHDRLHPSNGFVFELQNKGTRRAGLGEETALVEGDELVWRLPSRASARLLHNGKMVLEQRGPGRYEAKTPGVWRLEAYWPVKLFGLRPWIYSNPVYLR
jgi:hypothetical protein